MPPPLPYDAMRSVWTDTAAPAMATVPLAGHADCDVAIVGAGITGLSAALHLAERGLRACVLEARDPGWGASGRNGGQVIPGIKHDPDEILARHGRERGEPLLHMVGTAADTVFDLIDRYGLDCHPVRRGWIQPAHSRQALDAVLARARQWRARGADVAELDAGDVARRLGTGRFLGGWIDRRAGSIQPLRYTRGLLRAALSLGAAVHGQSPVVALQREGSRWLVRCAQGASVRAEHVLIATNAYTDDLWPGLRRTVIAANSFIVATSPLDPALAPAILPGGEVASDSRRLLLYFRRDADRRFILGGRGRFADPVSDADWNHLVRGARLLYPQLADTPFVHRWSGRVALTRDFVPHVHQPSPNLRIVLGYNGRGVALATQMGNYLAREISGGEPLPYPVTPIAPIPLHGLKRLYIGLAVAYYGLCDRIS
ncbi:NAD(P)/FAD-dependent oxidoreductase [Bordetella bronchiseptica]|uniref:NAD(P)/FAD-dependent oxidoreductase n=1 Tax=Bordetella bronchiseptica TaxID=518 RepID=UPI000F6FB9C2|nr:FAD-binding oxidoreductase [Bordetella bronchiseptica]VEF42122.1 Gamma-glutamylputrescine oxidoreductase [Bordetella bronchiseptica]